MAPPLVMSSCNKFLQWKTHIFIHTQKKKRKKKESIWRKIVQLEHFVLNHEAQKYLLKTQILMRKKFHLGCMYFLNIAFGQKRFNP